MEDVVVTAAFWSRRTVLVTGHTGFVGSWLSLWLQRLGADVIGFSVGVPTTPSLFRLADVESGMRSIVGDIRDRAALGQVIANTSPDVIIHLAAQAVVLRGYEDPVETFDTNVGGTINVLEAIRQRRSASAALIVTTDKVYRQSSSPHSEDDPIGGSDPYSGSKACAELVTQAYRASFFSDPERRPVAVATARAGNVIGGGDWTPHRIVPDLVRAFEARTPAVVRNPAHVRPWQHVLDPVSGYLMLCERLLDDGAAFAEAWNFGPPDAASAVSVATLVERAAALWGGGARWQYRGPLEGTVPPERAELRLDATKAMQRLRWSPRLDFEASIRSTVEWYRLVSQGKSARSVTLAQIEEYSD